MSKLNISRTGRTWEEPLRNSEIQTESVSQIEPSTGDAGDVGTRDR
jgi:hypothetical protein